MNGKKMDRLFNQVMVDMESLIGSVEALHRYCKASMEHERLTVSQFTLARARMERVTGRIDRLASTWKAFYKWGLHFLDL